MRVYVCVYAGVPVSSRVSAKIQQLVNTLKRPKRPPLREFFVDDFEELLEGTELIEFGLISSKVALEPNTAIKRLFSPLGRKPSEPVLGLAHCWWKAIGRILSVTSPCANLLMCKVSRVCGIHADGHLVAVSMPWLHFYGMMD